MYNCLLRVLSLMVLPPLHWGQPDDCLSLVLRVTGCAAMQCNPAFFLNQRSLGAQTLRYQK